MSPLPEINRFREHFEAGESQLLWSWIVSDTDTPVSAFLKLTEDEPYAFILESVEGGEVLGRYTIIGYDPDLIWNFSDELVTINGKPDQANALTSLRQTIAASHIACAAADLPPMATSGLFGFFGYDMIRQVEAIPNKNSDALHIPDSIFIRPRTLVIFDNIMHKICIVSPIYEHSSSTKKSADDVYNEAKQRIETCIKKLAAPLPVADTNNLENYQMNFKSDLTNAQFHGMVDQAKEYIAAGDIFQVVLSQRFSADFTLPPFEFYRSLRRINPSPFLFFLKFPEFSLAGSSPEILVRVRDNQVTIRPIAGTTKRGKDAIEDQANTAALLADPKERSEHLMLLDLGRNDVGKVAEIGSVQVTEQFIVEHYSHVMHIVSNVQGRLRQDLGSLDALLSGFPAGTVSGAPKIRAMEIIDELEPVQRKFYAGCVGYLAGNGNIDSCIALRTALLKDGKIYLQAGAGVVADSSPEYEYQETVNKAQALVRAAEDAVELHFQKLPSSQER